VKLARLVLWLGGLAFIGFGLAFALWPLPMARLVEIPLPTPTARIDFAATYGGFELGFGVFLLAFARRPPWFAPGLWATAAALSGFALIRLHGLLFAAGPVTRPIFIGLALEITGAVVSVLALRHLHTQEWDQRG
jgi:Domain of unknown function (DUF4345)